MIKTRIVRLSWEVFATLLLVGICAVVAGAQGLAPQPAPPLAPEINAGTLGSAVAMLVCGALIFWAKGQSQPLVVSPRKRHVERRSLG